ncbi:MAG: response regulator transcription factor [Pseudomonadales bacterium]
MLTSAQTVFIVDDDAAVRDSLQMLVRSNNLAVRTYDSASSFLEEYSPEQSGCLVLDVRMPDINGLELQRILEKKHFKMPIIFVSGHGDVPMAVEAMKAGAMEFLQKPFSDHELLESIEAALQRDRNYRASLLQHEEFDSLLHTLTPREHEVMTKMMDGYANKKIASDLGISQRTVEIYRANVMHKLRVGSLAELMKHALAHDSHGS